MFNQVALVVVSCCSIRWLSLLGSALVRSVAAALRLSGGLLQQRPSALCCSRYSLLLLLLQSGATSWNLLLLLLLLPGWASDRKNGWNAFPQVNPFSEPQVKAALIPLVSIFSHK